MNTNKMPLHIAFKVNLFKYLKSNVGIRNQASALD